MTIVGNRPRYARDVTGSTTGGHLLDSRPTIHRHWNQSRVLSRGLGIVTAWEPRRAARGITGREPLPREWDAHYSSCGPGGMSASGDCQ